MKCFETSFNKMKTEIENDIQIQEKTFHEKKQLKIDKSLLNRIKNQMPYFPSQEFLKKLSPSNLI